MINLRKSSVKFIFTIISTFIHLPLTTSAQGDGSASSLEILVANDSISALAPLSNGDPKPEKNESFFLSTDLKSWTMVPSVLDSENNRRKATINITEEFGSVFFRNSEIDDVNPTEIQVNEEIDHFKDVAATLVSALTSRLPDEVLEEDLNTVLNGLIDLVEELNSDERTWLAKYLIRTGFNKNATSESTINSSVSSAIPMNSVQNEPNQFEHLHFDPLDSCNYDEILSNRRWKSQNRLLSELVPIDSYGSILVDCSKSLKKISGILSIIFIIKDAYDIYVNINATQINELKITSIDLKDETLTTFISDTNKPVLEFFGNFSSDSDLTTESLWLIYEKSTRWLIATVSEFQDCVKEPVETLFLFLGFGEALERINKAGGEELQRRVANPKRCDDVLIEDWESLNKLGKLSWIFTNTVSENGKVPVRFDSTTLEIVPENAGSTTIQFILYDDLYEKSVTSNPIQIVVIDDSSTEIQHSLTAISAEREGSGAWDQERLVISDSSRSELEFSHGDNYVMSRVFFEETQSDELLRVRMIGSVEVSVKKFAEVFGNADWGYIGVSAKAGATFDSRPVVVAKGSVSTKVDPDQIFDPVRHKQFYFSSKESSFRHFFFDYSSKDGSVKQDIDDTWRPPSNGLPPNNSYAELSCFIELDKRFPEYVVIPPEEELTITVNWDMLYTFYPYNWSASDGLETESY